MKKIASMVVVMGLLLAPGVCLATSYDTGQISVEGSNDFSIKTINTPRVFIKNSGNVGIGTSNVTSELTVNGTIETTGGIKFPDGNIQIAAATTTATPSLDAVLAQGGTSTRTATLGDIIGQVIKTSGSGAAPSTASGIQSVAMGSGTTANGVISTAMGQGTTATGNSSTAMGFTTQANASYSTAMGYYTTASGTQSTAMGSVTTASGTGSVAMGNNFTNSTNNSLGIGNGNLDILLNPSGNSYLNANGGNVGIGTTNPGSKLTVAGTIETTGRLIVSGMSQSIYAGPVVVGTAETYPLPSGIIFGVLGSAGILGDIYAQGTVETDGGIKFPTGTQTMPYLGGSGEGSTPDLEQVLAKGNVSTKEATIHSLTLTNTLALGPGANPSGSYSVAMGSSTTASGQSSTAMGYNTTASNGYATAMGNGSSAGGSVSTALGNGTNASGISSTAMGNTTTASGNTSTSMGWNTTASGNYSLAAGQAVTAGTADNTIVLGKGVDNDHRLVNNIESSLMVGFGGTSPILFVSGEAVNGMVGIGTTEAHGNRLSVLGTIETVGTGGIKFPDGTTQVSAAGGSSNKVLKAGDTMTGTLTIDASGANLIVSQGNVGIGTTAPGAKLDVNGTVKVQGGSPADGMVLTAVDGTGLATWEPAAGGSTPTLDAVLAQGNTSTRDMSIGKLTLSGTLDGQTIKTNGGGTAPVQPTGSQAVAMGNNTTASGLASTAMGDGTTASGKYSVAMGQSTTASNYYAVAMGISSQASGYGAVAAGTTTVAGGSGNYQVAMGSGSHASGDTSTAFGLSTTAGGTASTAMGAYASANANYSTAMNLHTTSSGNATTAMGNYTTSHAFASLAIGQYNVVDTGSYNNWEGTDPVFVIGNGVDDSTRSNEVTVLKNGNFGIGTTSPGAILDVNGTAKIAKVLTAAQNSGVTLTTADFGKTITVSNGAGETVTLPDIGAGDIGGTFTIIKLNSGTVTVDAVGSDVIADSTAGGGINNTSATETFANITVQVAAADKWVVVGGHGTWTTF